VLFPPEQLISSEKLSRISYYFQKVTLTSPNHVFLQSSKMHSVHVLYSGEVEVSKLLKMDPPSPQEIKIHIIGSQEIIDDIDYFENQSAHSFSAKVQ
jgi:hypothetical protein